MKTRRDRLKQPKFVLRCVQLMVGLTCPIGSKAIQRVPKTSPARATARSGFSPHAWHGNGCDLIFNAFLYDHGLGEPKAVGAAAWQKKPNEPIFTYVDAASQLSGGYQNKEGHMNTWKSICRCFAAGRLALASPPYTNTGQYSEQICEPSYDFN